VQQAGQAHLPELETLALSRRLARESLSINELELNLTGLEVRKRARPAVGSTILSDRFDRTTGESFFAGRALPLVFRLFADVRVCVLERSPEVFRGQITADVTVDARAIDIEGSGNVFFEAVVAVGWHGRQIITIHRITIAFVRLDNLATQPGEISSMSLT